MRYLDTNLLKLSGRQLREFLPLYILAFICLVTTHQIQSYLPFLAKNIGDLVQTEQLETLELWQFAYLAAGIVLFRTISRLAFFYPARKLEVFLRLELMQALEMAHPLRYSYASKGDLFQFIQGDIAQLRALLGFAFLQIANVVISFSIIIPKIAKFHSSLLLGLLPLFLCTTIFYSIIRKMQVYFKRTMDLQGKTQNILIESYNGKKTIKNFHAEESFKKIFNQKSLEELENFYAAGKKNSFAIPLVRLGVGLSLICGAILIKYQSLPSTTFLLYSGFVFLLLEPLSFISWIGVVFSRSMSSWKRLKEFWNALTTESEKEKIINKEHRWLKTQSNDWKFETSLWDKPLCFEIQENKWNTIVGETGVGKTWILENILKSLANIGEKVSYVSQEPYIFNDTLYRNIFLGREANENEKDIALRLLNDFELTSLKRSGKKLFDIELGENGKQVSGGQAKRICIIRTLMSESNYLIWDDPFSSVDVLLEKLIINKLKEYNLIVNKTVVMTTHRLSTFRFTDHGVGLGFDFAVEQGVVADLLNEGMNVYEHFKQQMV